MKGKNQLFSIGLILAVLCSAACSFEDKNALDEFIAGEKKVLVCPVHVLDNQRSSYDSVSSLMIVEYINDNAYAEASYTSLFPPPYNTWKPNEAKMLTSSIGLFQDYVETIDLPEDTYILYPEFLKAGEHSTIIGVHYCLLNNKAEIAAKGLINSLWEAYQKVNPNTNEDCVRVLINSFENKMKK